MPRSIIHLVVGAVLLIAPTTTALAGEHARRAAAELAVIAGDLRKFDEPQLSPFHQTGLVERINGMLSSLDILMRLADEETARPPIGYRPELKLLRKVWGQRDSAEMKILIARLATRHPLNTAAILGLEPTALGLKQAAELHGDLCAGCHDQPDHDTKRPAYNLFAEVRHQSESEFIARMIVGIRGDRITGIDNPLDDAQLSALISYYRAGKAK